MRLASQLWIDPACGARDPGDEADAEMLSDPGSTLIERHLREEREIEVARRGQHEKNDAHEGAPGL